MANLLTAHPIESTAHVVMFDRTYNRRVNVPVLRRILSLSARFGVLELLQNNANIIRADWDRFFTFGSYTLVIVNREVR